MFFLRCLESLKVPGNDDKLSAFKHSNQARSSKFYMRMKDDQEYRKKIAEKEKLRRHKEKTEKFASADSFQSKNVFKRAVSKTI